MVKQNILSTKKLLKAKKAIKTGKLENAVKVLTQLCKKEPADTSALLLLASVYEKINQPQNVIECCHKIISFEAGNIVAVHHLAKAYNLTKQYNSAIQYYEKYLLTSQNDISALYELAKILYAINKINDSLNLLVKIIDLKPDHFNALTSLTKILIDQGNFYLAQKYCINLNEHCPDNYESLFQLAYCYFLNIQPDEARTTLYKCLELTDKPSHIYLVLANNELNSNHEDHLEKSADYIQLALKTDPDNIMALIEEAKVWYRQGHSSKVYTRLKKLINEGHVNSEIIDIYSSLCHQYNDCDYVIKEGEKLLNKAHSLTTEKNVAIHFCLGRIHDKAGRYKKAFNHYQQANDLEKIEYRPEIETSIIKNTITSSYAKNNLDQIKTASLKSERPVFIIGMPRSGTTLVEQVLSSHSKVCGAGELMEIRILNEQFIASKFDYNEPFHGNAKELSVEQLNITAQYYLDKLNSLSASALRITDKMPQNFLMLGFIMQLFPQAKIIHCTRHPLDTMLSIYFQHFSKAQSYSFKLENIAHYYLEYRKLMTHWKSTLNTQILEIPYSSMVNDFENTCKQLIDFTGIEWEEGCLHFHKSKRTTITASYDQVRSSIYKSSLNRWKHYEAFLDPLRSKYPELFE